MPTAKDRQAKRKKRKVRALLFAFFAATTVFLVLLIRIGLSDKAVELAYEIEQLAREKKSLEEENEKLDLEIARLRTPERISRIAVSDLNMVRASDPKVIVLER